MSHYNLLGWRRDRLAQNRDGFVRMLAGLIDAARFMSDPKNADTRRRDRAPHRPHASPTRSRRSCDLRRAIDFWPIDDDGLDRAKLDAVTQAAGQDRQHQAGQDTRRPMTGSSIAPSGTMPTRWSKR